MPSNFGNPNILKRSPPKYEANSRKMRVNSLPPGVTSSGRRIYSNAHDTAAQRKVENNLSRM